MSLGDRERIHSSLLAWVLGKNSPLPVESRARLLGALGVPRLEVSATISHLEWNHVDVLVGAAASDGPWHLAIEVKVKAEEHSGQLAKYDTILAGFGSRCTKVLLSLEGTLPRSGVGWHAVPFATLRDALATECGAAADHRDYLLDYAGLLGRLTYLFEHVDDEAVAVAAFDSSAQGPLSDYVTGMNLGVPLQQAWLRRALHGAFGEGSLDPYAITIGREQGGAYGDFARLVANGAVRVGLQLQHRSLKLFAHPYPYPKHATPAQIDASGAELQRVSRELQLHGMPSTPQARGFSSITACQLPKTRRLHEWTERLREVAIPALIAFHQLYGGEVPDAPLEAEGRTRDY